MNFGLTEQEIIQVKNIFRQFDEIESVLIFGSRAVNTHKKGSDVDLALKGDINLDVTAKVKAILEEETNLPYFFDVVDYATTTNPAFKTHIDQCGKIFYVKEKNKNVF